MNDHILKAAKEAGGTTYTNRHYPGATACAFGPEALERFYNLAYLAGMGLSAEICDSLQDIPATEPRHCAEDIRIRAEGICANAKTRTATNKEL